MAKRKILFAVAAHFSASDTDFVLSVIELARQRPAIQFAWSMDPSVERARNILTNAFLKSDCTHILFCDADISFTPDQVDRITSHDADVVGGLYPLKLLEPKLKWCTIRHPEKKDPRADGLLEVSYTGTGFMCIRRNVFEKMISAIGDQLSYIPAGKNDGREFAFWRQGIRARRFLTEDWMFCQTWSELGGKIFTDTHVILNHAGRAVWPLPGQLPDD